MQYTHTHLWRMPVGTYKNMGKDTHLFSVKGRITKKILRKYN